MAVKQIFLTNNIALDSPVILEILDWKTSTVIAAGNCEGNFLPLGC